MAAPFCTACGATVAEGTRFCVKCGQPVGQAASPTVVQTTIFTPPVSTPPPSGTQTPVWTPPPPPPVAQPVPVKEGSGAGLWVGLLGVMLLLGGGGAGLWFYTTRGPSAHTVSTVQVATAPTDPAPAQPSSSQPNLSQPTPTPASTFVPAPTPNPTTEVIPPNPDLAQKDAAPTGAPRQPSQHTAQPVETRPAAAPPRADPPPVQPVRPARQTSGVLHASVEVAQNGEVVFENLPGARLKFTFDHSAWQPTISHQPNGTQTLVMRSLKAGIQRTCDVQWEIVQ